MRKTRWDAASAFFFVGIFVAACVVAIWLLVELAIKAVD